MERCEWCGTDPLYIAYHDTQWGVPVHDDRLLFEMLVLEGAQAGLSWLTILRKREHYRRAFDGFSMETVAAYTDRDIERLMNDAGIVRNRLKIRSAVTNAGRVLDLIEAFGSFDAYLWRFVDHRPIVNAFTSVREVPAKTPLSDAISRDMKQRGLTFVGSTIVYSFMQAVGMVNDHRTGCFRYREVCLTAS
ncbi:DNA-3-methyladenine glycosylase I [Desulfatiferula olefinivorans]